MKHVFRNVAQVGIAPDHVRQLRFRDLRFFRVAQARIVFKPEAVTVSQARELVHQHRAHELADRGAVHMIFRQYGGEWRGECTVSYSVAGGGIVKPRMPRASDVNTCENK